MKYSVLIKPKVMIRIDGIEADSQKEAALKAVSHYEANAQHLMTRDLSNYNRDDPAGSFRYSEHADGELSVEALVDEEGDEEFNNSKWYLVKGDTPDDVLEDGGGKHKVMILWGENPQANETKPIDYEFDTLEELNAFLHGIDEGNGWLDYTQIDDPSNYCPVCFAELERFEGTVSCSFDDEHVVDKK